MEEVVRAATQPLNPHMVLRGQGILVVGQRYKSQGEEYILAQVTVGTFTLISLSNGNRLTEPVETITYITPNAYFAYVPYLSQCVTEIIEPLKPL